MARTNKHTGSIFFVLNNVDIRTRGGFIAARGGFLAARHVHVRASVLSSVVFWQGWEFYRRGWGDGSGSHPTVRDCSLVRRVNTSSDFILSGTI